MEHRHFDTTLTTTANLHYLFHLPPGYSAERGMRWPLILFLHGHGESGSDPRALLRHGIPKIVEQQPDFPFIAVAPQCPWGTWWPELSASLIALHDNISQAYAVDPERIYLTGLSMGGYGTWYLASHHPERFAAIAPICGGGYWFHGFPEKVCGLKETPVWAFHGARDEVVPLAESQTLVERLQACGGRVKLTVYPDAGHDSWSSTYANPQLYRWFLTHRRDAGRARQASSM